MTHRRRGESGGRTSREGLVGRLLRATAPFLGARPTTVGDASRGEIAQRERIEPDAPIAGPRDERRILCFSPYAMWSIHSAWEITVLRALARRGCETRLVFCDAASPVCDLHWERFWGPDHRPYDRCLECQSRTALAAREMRHPFEWLSRSVDTAERDEATAWAESLPDDGLREATFRGAALGEWCEGSVFSHFRISRLDPEDPRIRAVYRQYLAGAAVTLIACRRLLDTMRPDILWLFNGRMSLPRVAFESARQRGIRVICHERGGVFNSLRLWENERCSEFRGLRDAVLQNADRPLSTSQAEAAVGWVADRRAGKNIGGRSFAQPRGKPRATLAEAGLSPGDRFVLVLTSSDDEFASAGNRNRVFREQYEWIRAAVEWASRFPDRRLVVRFHPNTSPASWAYLAGRLPGVCAADDMAGPTNPSANVCVIPPKSTLDTYAFIDACAVATTYGSTTGIEAGALGKTVIVADECRYHDMAWVRSAESPLHFGELLDRAFCEADPAADVAVATGALRYVWDGFLGSSITSHRIANAGPHRSRIAYPPDLAASLDYGGDAGIDRITDTILGDRPMHDLRPAGDDDTLRAERAVVAAHLKRCRTT